MLYAVYDNKSPSLFDLQVLAQVLIATAFKCPHHTQKCTISKNDQTKTDKDVVFAVCTGCHPHLQALQVQLNIMAKYKNKLNPLAISLCYYTVKSDNKHRRLSLLVVIR